MRAIVARRIRRKVYSSGHHLGVTKYFVGDKSLMKSMPRNLQGCCISDQPRRDYQAAKRLHVRERNS